MNQSNHKELNDPPLIAVLDLGSNSFHMTVGRIEKNEIRPVKKMAILVQLAAGLSRASFISDEAMKKGLDCLAEFAQFLSGIMLKSVRIVATSALRRAKNSDAFIEKALEIIPYPVEIISGEEEARLIYLGVAKTQSDNNEQQLVIDIGGGSTELIIGKRFEPIVVKSLDMGCVIFTERFFKEGRIISESFQAAYSEARLNLLQMDKQYRKIGWTHVLGSSGSIRSASRITLETTASDVITPENLNALKNRVLNFNNTNSLKLLGLSSERKAVFLGGLAILLAVFDALDIKQMRLSEGALREGVLYDMMGKCQYEPI